MAPIETLPVKLRDLRLKSSLKLLLDLVQSFAGFLSQGSSPLAACRGLKEGTWTQEPSSLREGSALKRSRRPGFVAAFRATAYS